MHKRLLFPTHIWSSRHDFESSCTTTILVEAHKIQGSGWKEPPVRYSNVSTIRHLSAKDS